eukprot:scaffold87215_cov20-Tisochrysis_lutea.AAC.2
MAKRRKYALLTAMLMTLPKMLLKFAQSVSYMLALSCRCKCTHCNMGGSCASSPAASHPICDPYCLGGCASWSHSMSASYLHSSPVDAESESEKETGGLAHQRPRSVAAHGGMGALALTGCCHLSGVLREGTVLFERRNGMDARDHECRCEEHNRWTRGDLHVLAATCNTRTDA